MNEQTMTVDDLISLALQEDIGEADHTSLATIPSSARKKARLLIKEAGILAGVDIARKVFMKVDPDVDFNVAMPDGTIIKKGDIAFTIEGQAIAILSAERLALNFLQRLSGIATYTYKVVAQLQGLHTRVLDTRKTTPLWRELEKYAVRTGGGYNHRAGLYDMILIKDNHIDFAGGITNSIQSTRQYLARNKMELKIEIEVRDFAELNEVLAAGGIHRIMLDNFSPVELKKAVGMIQGRYETEASGSIRLENIREYAETGVDFISVGALTHQIKSLDMSLEAVP
ncbi:MAG: carboxylating nicotinate-nucleotide diphosphorylase [Bacteroidetes bacterium]|nr:carboxylating nicotinate-nucleotide diphosphorylase [Bacteroidota bacterium]